MEARGVGKMLRRGTGITKKTENRYKEACPDLCCREYVKSMSLNTIPLPTWWFASMIGSGLITGFGIGPSPRCITMAITAPSLTVVLVLYRCRMAGGCAIRMLAFGL